VNCRIEPGHSAEEVRKDLINILADPNITVRYVDNFGNISGQRSRPEEFPPPPLRRDVFAPLEKNHLRDVARQRRWFLIWPPAPPTASTP